MEPGDKGETIQGTPAVSECLLGYNACPRQRSCRISARLRDIQRTLVDLLRSTTIADVLRGGHTKEAAGLEDISLQVDDRLGKDDA